MFQRLSDALFGVKLDPSLKCRWCPKPIGQVSHAPIPVCADCFHRAYTHTKPHFYCDGCFDFALKLRVPVKAPCAHDPGNWPGNVWEKLMTEFRAEAERWVRSIQASPSKLELTQGSTEAMSDMLTMQREVFALIRAGRSEDAAVLNAQVQKKATEISKFQAQIDQMLQQMNGGGPLQ